MRKEIRAGHEELIATTETNQEKMMVEFDAHHERMMVRMNSQLEKMEAWAETNQKDAMDLEANPEETEAEAEHWEVPKDEAAADAVGALNERHGDRKDQVWPNT
jgi:hypothetical protein